MKKSFYFLFFALLMLTSCQERKPSMVEQRREEIRKNDSTELAQARIDLEEAGSEVRRLENMVEAFKDRFVFEKVEKYQTQGYWVLPSYKGSKERFMFFPEVEESGKMLLVNIDKQRRYAFTEVNLDNEDYKAQLPKGFSKQQIADVDECYAFAKTMKLLEEARQRQEKMTLKIRFYEEKIKRAK